MALVRSKDQINQELEIILTDYKPEKLNEVEALLIGGADANHEFTHLSRRTNPLNLAIKKRALPLIQLLIKHGANLRSSWGLLHTPLESALEAGLHPNTTPKEIEEWWPIVNELLNALAKNKVENDKKLLSRLVTPCLMLAPTIKDKELMLEKLIEQLKALTGLENLNTVYEREAWGITTSYLPLHYVASLEDGTGLIKKLVENGADPKKERPTTSPRFYPKTPIAIAAYSGCGQNVLTLLEMNIDFGPLVLGNTLYNLYENFYSASYNKQKRVIDGRLRDVIIARLLASHANLFVKEDHVEDERSEGALYYIQQYAQAGQWSTVLLFLGVIDQHKIISKKDHHDKYNTIEEALGYILTCAIHANTAESNAVADKLFAMKVDCNQRAHFDEVGTNKIWCGVPLQIAARRKDKALMLRLLEANADPNKGSSMGEYGTFIEILAEQHAWDMIPAFLTTLATLKKSVTAVYVLENWAKKVLFEAIQSSEPAAECVIRPLLSAGVSHQYPNDRFLQSLKKMGRTFWDQNLEANALDLAVKHERKAIIAILLEFKATPTLLDVKDETLLELGGQLLVDVYANARKEKEAAKQEKQAQAKKAQEEKDLAEIKEKEKEIAREKERETMREEVRKKIQDAANRVEKVEEIKAVESIEPTNPALLQINLKGLDPDLAKELNEKLKALVDCSPSDEVLQSTRKLIERAVLPFANNLPVSQETIDNAEQAVCDYKREVLALSTGQKVFVAAMSIVGLVLGVILGFAAGLAAGVAIGGGVGTVAPVFGNVIGAIAGGSIVSVAGAVEGGGAGAIVGSLMGMYCLGVGACTGAGLLTRFGIYKNTPVNKQALDVIAAVEHLAEDRGPR